jgi:hypothetical protein
MPSRAGLRQSLRGRLEPADDRGSTIPLILGFFLIALVMVAGAIVASDAFTKQRDLQSVCDGAALAAANAVDGPAARTETLTAALPLAPVQQAAQSYLDRDPARQQVTVRAALSADGHLVLLDCSQHTTLAFQRLLGRPNGFDQHVTSSAQGDLH